MFLSILFLPKSDHFAKPMGIGKWPILPLFKSLPFFGYLRFFDTIFCIDQLYFSSRVFMSVFLSILILASKRPFCQAYSLWKMANFATFQELVIFRIFAVFGYRFLHTSTLLCFYSFFANFLVNLNFSPKVTILPSL